MFSYALLAGALASTLAGTARGWARASAAHFAGPFYAHTSRELQRGACAPREYRDDAFLTLRVSAEMRAPLAAPCQFVSVTKHRATVVGAGLNVSVHAQGTPPIARVYEGINGSQVDATFCGRLARARTNHSAIVVHVAVACLSRQVHTQTRVQQATSFGEASLFAVAVRGGCAARVVVTLHVNSAPEDAVARVAYNSRPGVASLRHSTHAIGPCVPDACATLREFTATRPKACAWVVALKYAAMLLLWGNFLRGARALLH